MPRISVIVPVYNAEKYLDSCINSILHQTFNDFELILIDDGSSDSSGEKCDKYAQLDNRIKVLHQKNGGVTSARRLGVKNAIGDFVTFVDSDDELYKGALYILISNANHDDIDIILSDLNIEKLIVGDQYVKKTLTGNLYNRIWGNLYRRSLLTDWVMDIPRKINIGEDAIMNIRIGLGMDSGKVAKCINDRIYMYRLNLDSVINTRMLSLEYEELYISELKKTLGGNMEKYKAEYYFSNLCTLENLIVCRVPVNYDRPWIEELINWYKNKPLSFRHRVVLTVRHNLLCKSILAIEKRVKKIVGNA